MPKTAHSTNIDSDKGFKFFFKRFLIPFIPYMILILFLKFLGLLFALILPLLTKILIDDAFIGKNTEIMVNIIIISLILYIISGICVYLNNFFQSKMELSLFKEVAEECYNVIQFSKIKELEKTKIGDLIYRIMNNIQMAVDIPTTIVPNFFMGLVGLMFPLIIMLSMNLKIGLIVMSPLILFIASSFIFGNRLEKLQTNVLNHSSSLYSSIKENLSMIFLIKVFGLENWSQKKFSQNMSNFYNTSINFSKVSSLNLSINDLLFEAPLLLLIIFGGPMVINGSMSIGSFTAFASYIALFFSPVSQISSIWASYKTNKPAFYRIKELFEFEQDISGSNELKIEEGIVKFEEVSFSYDTNKTILYKFNASFRSGLNYIIGDNGTGKSTIFKLLCSIYTPSSGSITIDGQKINNIKTENLRKNISMIFSEPYLFEGSIYENIRIGNLFATEEQIVAAANAVSVHNYIKSLPDKYHTNVSESGMNLSSGEKQKIALARAILKDSPIILLDEVTKSIDFESRQLINKVIKNLKSDKTIIIITHHEEDIEPGSNIIKLSTIQSSESEFLSSIPS